MKIKSKLLATLLIFTLFFSISPVTYSQAESEEGYSFTIVSSDEEANFEIDVYTEGATKTDDKGWKYITPTKESSIYFCPWNMKYNSDKFKFVGWKITCGNDSIGPVTNMSAENIAAGLSKFKPEVLDYRHSIISETEFSLYGHTTADMTITAVFDKIYNPSDAVYTASGKVNGVNLGKVDCLYGGNSIGKDKWTLTAEPADNMQFSHWNWVEFKNNPDGTENEDKADVVYGKEKIYDNPLVVLLDENTGSRTYTAHFEPVDVKLEQQGGRFDTSINKDIVIGGRQLVKIPYYLPNSILGNVKIEYEVYQGDGTLGTQLCKGTKDISGKAGSQFLSLNIDPLPSSIKDEQFITVKARLSDNNGERSWHTQSYDISSTNYITPEVDNTFHYLSTTDEANETGGFTDAGPDIQNVSAFIDDITGKLHLFLSSKKGVYAWAPTGKEDLSLMGMNADLKEKIHSDNLCGGIYAVSGSCSDGLLGMVLTKERDEMSQYYSSLCEYNFAKQQWKLIPNTKFVNIEDQYGVYPNLILSSNDIWSDNEYWDGSNWSNKETEFNSFYKIDNQLAFGAANDGLYKITSGGNTAQMPVLKGENCFIQSGSPSHKLVVKTGSSKYYLVDAGAETCTEIPSGVDDNSNIKTMGFGCNDTLYKAQKGRGYLGKSNYCETDIFRFVTSSNEWIRLEIPEFMDENDDRSVLNTKIRPSYISSIVHPIPEVSIFTSPKWGYGSIYAQYYQTEHTITFDALGGTCDKSPTNGKLGDKVSIPTPSKANCKFEGWYYSPNCVGEEFTSKDTMPAKDITLYAKWNSGGDDKYASDREKAMKSLEEAFAKCDQSEYTEKNWNKIIGAYEKGKYNIETAKPTDHLAKEIYDALNMANAAFGEIPTIISKKAEVCVSMEANTLGLGYLVKPTIVTIDKNTKASKVITDLLTANGYTWEMTGKIDDSFYLAQVKPVDQTKVIVADYILKHTGANISYGNRTDDMLGEFDYYSDSGWMYSMGDNKNSKYPKFPGVGASGWRMTDGEVMRWQFTVYGYGADLNANNESFGSKSIVPNLGNKSKLTWKVGELRGKYTDEELEANAVYQEAIKVLINPEANQNAVDNSLNALINAFDGNTGDSSGSGGHSGGGSSSTIIDKKVDYADAKVTKEVKATIDSKGKATASIDAKDLSSSLSKAVQAVKDSKKNIKPEVMINVKADSNKAKSVEMSMKKSSLSELTKNEAKLTVDTPLATIAFDEKSVKAIGEKAKGNEVRFDVSKTDAANVIKDLEDINSISDTNKSEIVKAVANRNIFDLSILSGEENVTSFGKGTVKVSLPYTLSTGEKSSNLGVAYITEDRNMEKISSNYNTKTKKLEFETSHFSYYAITYDDNVAGTGAKTQFGDVKASDWYSTSVMSLVEKGIIKGKTINAFEPNSNITRAEFAQLLCGLAKSKSISGVSGKENVFSDVKTGQWYAEAVNWAYANGVVKGTSDATFSPNSNISRQDMAVMIQNYVEKVEKKTLTEKNTAVKFVDNERISSYANDAVSLMQRAGVINGIKNADNTYNFEPKNNATRAQAAKMIYEII